MHINLLTCKPIITQPEPGSELTFKDKNDKIQIYDFEFQSFGMFNGFQNKGFTVNCKGNRENYSELQYSDDSDVASIISMLSQPKDIVHLSLRNIITEAVPFDLLLAKRDTPCLAGEPSISNNSDRCQDNLITKKKSFKQSVVKDSPNDSMDNAILRHDCSSTKESFKRVKRYQRILKAIAKEERRADNKTVSLVQLFKKNIS